MRPLRPVQKGSILAPSDTADPIESYVIEGIGYDFVPDVLDRSGVDAWVKTVDEESFTAVRSIMRAEGLLVGGSSGSALAGALRWLRDTDAGRRIAATESANVVIVLADGRVYSALRKWVIDLTDTLPGSGIT
jgi:cystathionine beta-synthase